MRTLNSISRLLILCAAGVMSIALTSPAQALESPFQNIDQLARTLGITGMRVKPRAPQLVKIAILDNGFRNYQDEIGKTLPRTTQFHAGPIAVDPQTEESHGLFMAQIVAGLLDRTGDGTLPVELHLFSTFGYSNLKAAVEAVIAQKFDVVLYSQVWEYGGNGDGHGFINSLVSQATSAGTIWVNASGNFADATYMAPITRIADDWARLPSTNSSIRVRCLPHEKTADQNREGDDDRSVAARRAKTCHLRAVLSWNDFKDDVNAGTEKDLDLVLTDDTLKIVQSSGLVQKRVLEPGAPGQSLYPREIIEADVNPGLYYLRVKVRSNNFDRSTDILRLTTSGDFVQQLDVTDGGDTLLPPADNRTVITVGATDSEKSSRGDQQRKPELSFASAVKLKNGETYKGSSNSAAIAATGVVILKAYHADLNRGSAITMLRGGIKSEGSDTPSPRDGDDTDDQDSDNGQTHGPIQNPKPGPARRPPPRGPIQSPPKRAPTSDQDHGQRDDDRDQGQDRDQDGGSQTHPSPAGQGLPLSALGFGPTGPGGCFAPIRLPVQTPAMAQLYARGAVGVMTTMGPKIFTPVDPFSYLPGWRRNAPDDILLINLQGFGLLPRSEEPVLSNLGYEVTVTPLDSYICDQQPAGRQPGLPEESRDDQGSSRVRPLPNGYRLPIGRR